MISIRSPALFDTFRSKYPRSFAPLLESVVYRLSFAPLESMRIPVFYPLGKRCVSPGFRSYESHGINPLATLGSDAYPQSFAPWKVLCIPGRCLLPKQCVSPVFCPFGKRSATKSLSTICSLSSHPMNSDGSRISMHTTVLQMGLLIMCINVLLECWLELGLVSFTV